MSCTNFLSMESDMDTMRVGDPCVSNRVYKYLICSVAPYFNNALTNDFKEVADGEITLSDASELVFRTFWHWAKL